MDNTKQLVTAYRKFLLELGNEFAVIKNQKLYDGYADTFIDFVKSPEIGFTVDEVNKLMAMNKMFELLEPHDLPSHHIMKLMVRKSVDMDLLESAKTLSLADFKELIKDEEIGTQERTYKYQVMKRSNETGNLYMVPDHELPEAIKAINEIKLEQ